MLASDDVVSCQVGNPRAFLPKNKDKKQTNDIYNDNNNNKRKALKNVNR